MFLCIFLFPHWAVAQCRHLIGRINSAIIIIIQYVVYLFESCSSHISYYQFLNGSLVSFMETSSSGTCRALPVPQHL